MLLLRTHFSEFVNHKFPFLAFLFFLLPFLLLITYNLKWPLLLSYHPSLPLFLSLLTFPRLLLCQISPPFSPLACPSFCFHSSSLLSSWSSKLGHVFGSKANTASFKQHQSHTHTRAHRLGWSLHFYFSRTPLETGHGSLQELLAGTWYLCDCSAVGEHTA